MRILLRLLGGLAACACMLLGTGTARAAGAAPAVFGATTCSGGTIAAGTYQSLTVTGICSIPNDGVVTVLGGLTIAPNALFNAITPATLNVSGGAQVEPGGSLLVGCSPAAGCGTTTSDLINGGVHANQPLVLIFHSNTINGGVSVQGGGGGFNCDINPILSEFAGFPSPNFSTFEDNSIRGAVTISGMLSCWFGFIRNQDHGSVTIANNRFRDDDATEVVTNTVRGSLACSGNTPPAQVGDSGGLPNTVTGQKLGECASL
jgi:hypothetical protein